VLELVEEMVIKTANTNKGEPKMRKIVISSSRLTESSKTRPVRRAFRHGGWFGRVGDKGGEEIAKLLLDEALGGR
jgi:hypothetical protein